MFWGGWTSQSPIRNEGANITLRSIQAETVGVDRGPVQSLGLGGDFAGERWLEPFEQEYWQRAELFGHRNGK